MVSAIRSRRPGQAVRSAVLFYNEQKPDTQVALKPVLKMLKDRRVAVSMGHTPEGRKRLPDADVASALGGDGTMLRVARSLAPHGVPLFGINSGGLGFLSGTELKELKRNLATVLDGGFELQERWMLEVEVLQTLVRQQGDEAVELHGERWSVVSSQRSVVRGPRAGGCGRLIARQQSYRCFNY